MEIEKQGQASLNHKMVFSFCATVLSGSICTREVMMNTRRTKMGFKAVTSKFCTIVTLKFFYTSRMLIFHIFLEMNKSIIEVRFQFQWIKLSEKRIIINE